MHMKQNIMMINHGGSFYRLETMIDYIGNSEKHKSLLENIHSMQEYKGNLNIIWNSLPEKKILMAISQSWEDLANELSENVHHYELTEKSVSCKGIRKLREIFRK